MRDCPLPLLFPERVVVTVGAACWAAHGWEGVLSAFSRPCGWVFKLRFVRTFNKHGCDKRASVSSPSS